MKVEEFYNKVKSDKTYGTKSRVLVIRNRLEQRELRKLFEERPHEFGWVRFSKCVTAEAFVPPPESVFALIREANSFFGRLAFITSFFRNNITHSSSVKLAIIYNRCLALDAPTYNICS